MDNIIVERNAIGYENKEPFVVLAKTGEKRAVKVVSYGKEYVKVTEGLEGGEQLLQQSKSPKSGQNRNNNPNGNGTNQNRNNGQNFGGGMPGSGMPNGGGMPPMGR